MSKLYAFLKKYRIFVVLFGVNIILLIFAPAIGLKSFKITMENLFEMLTIIPPVFILLGLLDVWVPKEAMMRYMGNDSGFRGIFLSFFMGAAAAGPLYIAFPIAGVLLKKGCSILNVLIFIGAWSTMKIPLLIFETTSLGIGFSSFRLLLNIIGIPIIAIIIDKSLKESDKEMIYQIAEKGTDK